MITASILFDCCLLNRYIKRDVKPITLKKTHFASSNEMAPLVLFLLLKSVEKIPFKTQKQSRWGVNVKCDTQAVSLFFCDMKTTRRAEKQNLDDVAWALH